MKLSILIPSVPQRDCSALLRSLKKQTQNWPAEILVDTDPGTSGQKRQRLTEASTSSYITFVDDDDQVSGNYVSSICSAISSGADVISFNLDFHVSGRRRETWKFGLFNNNRQAGIMCVNHLCAWRRELATQVAWDPNLGQFDDHIWFQPLYKAKLVSTCYHIDKSLYYYLYDEAITINQSPSSREFARKYIGSGLTCFKKGKELLVEVGPPGSGLVRDKHNQIHSITNDMHPYAKAK